MLELDNNICERSIRPIALGRKNYLFMRSIGGGKAAAIAYRQPILEFWVMVRRTQGSLCPSGGPSAIF
jgi:hypothetical protein